MSDNKTTPPCARCGYPSKDQARLENDTVVEFRSLSDPGQLAEEDAPWKNRVVTPNGLKLPMVKGC